MRRWVRNHGIHVGPKTKNRPKAAFGAHEWNRTIDLLLTKEVLYRLSYVGKTRIVWTINYACRSAIGAGDGNRTRVFSLEG